MTKIRMGMAGGGQGAFIGAIHRMAAALDGQIELVCGAFSSDPDLSKASGRDLNLPLDRCYANYQEMFECEATLPADERMEFVAIVTPNHLHFPIAKAALENGFHVLSDKPATLSLNECLALRKMVHQKKLLYGLTHVYTGYPMVIEAQHLVAKGKLGKIRKVVVEYFQGWLANECADAGKQASWRLDPDQSGVSGCIGDIGVHASNLVETMIGQKIESLCADLTTFGAGRVLDDDGSMLLRFASGAKGVLMASQIATGEENGLRIRVYGDRGALDWSQQEPNSLFLKGPDRPVQRIRAGQADLCEAAQSNSRTPSGHPEGYLEAFANIYTNFADRIRLWNSGATVESEADDFTGIDAAVEGMAFIETAVLSSDAGGEWKKVPRH